MSVYILDILRSPIGSYLGNLSNLNCVDLSMEIVKELIKRNQVNIDMCYIGNVISSGNGQNIARNISYNAGLNIPSITVNNVCGSGMESIRQGYNDILSNQSNVILVGGVESMSNTPYLNKNIKKGNKMGNITMLDSMIQDGLTDMFSNKHMGELVDKININNNITIEEMNKYAELSYKRARQNINNIKKEILPIKIGDKIIDEDEEINKIQDLNKIHKLKPVFGKTITAGNASKLSDGCCFMILCSEKYIKENSLKPIAKILDVNIVVGEPENFCLLPIKSVQQILKNNVEIDLYEINEAFATVPIMFSKELNISYDYINIYGGAISLGHPLGCSGSRIVSSLINCLRSTNKKIGCASICIGGGSAQSLLLEIL